MSSTTDSWASTQARRITAGFGMRCSGRFRHLFPRDFPRSLSAVHPDIYRRVAPGALTSPACLRSPRRGLDSSCLASFSGASLCPPRDQGEVAPSIVSRCGPERLQRSLCDLPSARAPAARCGPHHHGCGRAIRTASDLKRLTINEAPSCGLRRPSDRHRPRLSNSRLRSAAGNPRWSVPRTRTERDRRNTD
jgi:hypothetical protein